MKLPTELKPSSDAAMLNRFQRVEEKMYLLCAEPGQQKDIFLTALDGHLRAGGQRARAQICLSCADKLGLSESDSVALAASVELLHNASLIQDDLQDKARLRRGAPTVWSKYGVDCAIGLTDLTIAAAFRALVEISNSRAIPGLIEHLYRAISVTMRGQSDDLGGSAANLERALSIARRKSGPLFALALELPLHLGGRHEFLKRACEAAEAFGLGYQIYDDIVDVGEDRASKSQNNIVVALEYGLPPEKALESARLLARQHLKASTSIALELVDGCGQALADLATQIGNRLNAHFK